MFVTLCLYIVSIGAAYGRQNQLHPHRDLAAHTAAHRPGKKTKGLCTPPGSLTGQAHDLKRGWKRSSQPRSCRLIN
ncbi:hypothetical protein LZ31DRAFT_145773 [Colletotrichum somersetense]|nr:hypothetical protein LZ31DRAFT_145773 [Colletotrichum somersetense]